MEYTSNPIVLETSLFVGLLFKKLAQRMFGNEYEDQTAVDAADGSDSHKRSMSTDGRSSPSSKADQRRERFDAANGEQKRRRIEVENSSNVIETLDGDNNIRFHPKRHFNNNGMFGFQQPVGMMDMNQGFQNTYRQPNAMFGQFGAMQPQFVQDGRNGFLNDQQSIPSFHGDNMYQQRPFRGRGRGRGSYNNHNDQHFVGLTRPQSYGSKILVVDNIPQDYCDETKVSDYFKAFGSIESIKVDQSARKALIEYSRHDEARAAHSNPDVIFGNRFVKVFWLKDEDVAAFRSGMSGSLLESGNSPSVAHTRGLSADAQKPYHLRPQISRASLGGNDAHTSNDQDMSMAENVRKLQHDKTMQILETQKEKEAQIAKQIEQQKQIMQRLEDEKNTLTAQEKKKLLQDFKALDESTKLMVSTVATQTQLAKTRATSAMALMGKSPLLSSVSKDDNDMDISSSDVDPALKARLESLKGEVRFYQCI